MTDLEIERETRRYLQSKPIAVALLAVAALAGLVWLGTRSLPQLLLALAIVTVTVIDAMLARLAMADLRVHLHVPALATVGEPLLATITLSGLRGAVVVGPASAPRRSHVVVDGQEPGLIRLPAMARGVLRSVVIDASATGPLGLFTASRRLRVTLPTDVAVAPLPLPHLFEWPDVRTLAFGPTERAPVGDDLYRSVRPYVRGDSARRVHWKASAHHGELMVKESDGTGVSTLRVVVELDAPGPAAEVAVGRAAWLVEEALRLGWVVRLVTLNPQWRPPEPAFALGRPYGLPPRIPAMAPAPLRVVDRRVANLQAARHQLATAGFGPVDVGGWRGTTCVVTPRGDRWE